MHNVTSSSLAPPRSSPNPLGDDFVRGQTRLVELPIRQCSTTKPPSKKRRGKAGLEELFTRLCSTMEWPPKVRRLAERNCKACGGPTSSREVDHVLCDTCNAVWHLRCVGLDSLPVGPWHYGPCYEAHLQAGTWDITLDVPLIQLVFTGELNTSVPPGGVPTPLGNSKVIVGH